MSNSFFGVTRVDRVKRFAAHVEGVSDPKRRELESRLLTPDPMPIYTGPKASPTQGILFAQTIKLVFKSARQAALFEKHFSVSCAQTKSCYRLSKLLAFLHAMEDGDITYEKDDGLFHVRPGVRVKIVGGASGGRKCVRKARTQEHADS